MARIPMTSGFQMIPEGTYIFRIYDTNYDEEFGKLEIKMVTAKGYTHIERFRLLNNDSTFNDGAMNAFSYFAKTAMNDFSLQDIDPNELINHYIEAEVIHTKVPAREGGKPPVTFANLGQKAVAEGFDEEPTEKALTIGRPADVPIKADAPAEDEGFDLDSLLS